MPLPVDLNEKIKYAIQSPSIIKGIIFRGIKY